MKNIIVWIASVLIAQLFFHAMRILWEGQHYFWFSILITVVHDYGFGWRNWFLWFFENRKVQNEQ